MKKIVAIAALCMLALTAGCSKVPNGFVGVKVNMLGSDKGVQADAVGPGRYWLTPNEEIFQFPTFTQNFNLGVVTFQTQDGLKVSAPVGVSLYAKPDSAPILFKTFRKGMNEIVEINAAQVIRNQFNTQASLVKVDAVYGKGKADFLKGVETSVREHFERYGIVVDSLYLTGDIVLPPTVTAALNAKVESTQKAEQRANEVAQTIAEADKAREQAKGEADAITTRAIAEAESLNIRGEAMRKNPGVVELNAIEKWNGVLPVYMTSGTSTPFISVGK
ncbi:transposase [Pseudomonas weihenstephanensis]|uniref:Transposase n=2 Tax=Pseudomonas weihenstephanensis TaxID=1608994 RepID=A0A0J6LC57_9PSED|nr:transposase [Pseudomonas weihenstephanensis]